MTHDRDAGIRAIIALQKVADIDETPEKAGAGWDGMSPRERDVTMETYALLFGEETCAQPTPRQ